MHTTLNKETLLWGLDCVARTSTKHQTLPVLQCVLLEAKKDPKNKKGVVILKTTNLELGVEATLPADVLEEGVVAVPAITLLETANLLSDKDVSLKKEKETLKIEAKKAKTEIKTFPHEEFPNIPTLTGKTQKVNGSVFALGIKTAVFAVSQSSIKPELGSVYVGQHKEHTLTFVATDSFRLTEKTTSQKSVTLDTPLLIPHKNALELARVLDTAEADPELCVSENQCSLTFGFEDGRGLYITSRLTNGTFPDYKQIIPKEYVTHCTVLKADLVHALKKTNIFTNRFFQVGVSVDPKKQQLQFSADSGEVGTTTEECAAEVDGEALTLSFNQRYLSEPLAHFTDESLILHFAGVGRPMVIEGVHEKSLRYLVMPMNR